MENQKDVNSINSSNVVMVYYTVFDSYYAHYDPINCNLSISYVFHSWDTYEVRVVGYTFLIEADLNVMQDVMATQSSV